MIKIESNVNKKTLEQFVEDFAERYIHTVGEGTVKRARRNFNKAIRVTGADISRSTVEVFASYGHHSVTISCIGEQVLFQEFGAGRFNIYSRKVDYNVDDISDSVTWRDNFSNTTWKYGSRGEVEELKYGMGARPAGIIGLGKYGKGYGMNEIWVRPSQDGIPNLDAGESYVHKKNGDIKVSKTTGDTMIWTYGTPPTRSLYRAVISSLRSGGNK